MTIFYETACFLALTLFSFQSVDALARTHKLDQFEHGKQFLSDSDPIMRDLIESHVIGNMPVRKDSLGGLAQIIINQQLSNKAAATIFHRFKILFQGQITSRKILALSDSDFAAAGISRPKASYIRALAERLAAEPKFLQKVRAADDQYATQLMTSIKGIGPWSAQIFLMFNLGRLDIFPIGDLILNRAIRTLYEAQPGEEASVAERWTPFRSIASMHLWRWTDDS